MRDASATVGIDEAVTRGVLSKAEGARLRESEQAVAEAVAVDDFEPGALSRDAGDYAERGNPALSEAS